MITLIDPVSPEFNRGSFCYSPYLLYASMKAQGSEVSLYENFCAADVDSLPQDCDAYGIALWSHPQIEHVRTLVRFLPRGKVFVFGYTPLAQAEGFLTHIPTGEDLLLGMSNYHRHFHSFSQILLSDCDMHLKEFSGQVYPLFTSYGCPNQCAFCPSSANQPVRLALPIADVKQVLNEMADYGYTNIHFTDEDFFFDEERAHAIALHLKNHSANFQLIALAERRTLAKYMVRYGGDTLLEAGFKLLEVGLETASSDLGSVMAKPGDVVGCEGLSKTCPVPILWLTLTFFPGETIRSLGETGAFLKNFGLNPNKLYPRIATNGTLGGLGQFFQPYEGTRLFNKVPTMGKVLTNRPLRLMPSFLPNSFLQDNILFARDLEDEELHWFDLYRVNPPKDLQKFRYGTTIEKAAKTWPSLSDGCIALAICARLGAIA